MKLSTLELTSQIMTSRTVSRSEHHWIASLLAQGQVTPQERTLIQRILYGIRHGLLTLTD